MTLVLKFAAQSDVLLAVDLAVVAWLCGYRLGLVNEVKVSS